MRRAARPGVRETCRIIAAGKRKGKEENCAAQRRGLVESGDFYLPELDVYIEFWGLETPQYKMSMYKKQTLYQQEGKRLLSVYPADLARLGEVLASKLRMFGCAAGGR
jgi:hypothetical protein